MPGLIVLASFISPFRSERSMARELLRSGEFIEVFIDTPLAVAEQRDCKHLYEKARRGEIKNFTGIDSPYEPPEDPEIHIDGAHTAPEQAAEQIFGRAPPAWHPRSSVIASQIDLQRVIDAARAAGEVVLEVYGRGCVARDKADGSPVTEADERAQEVILAGLKRRSATAFRSSPRRRRSRTAPRRALARFWLVDPLDGTKEFLGGNGEFTVNIALIEDGLPVLGVVLAPARDRLFAAGPDDGAILEDESGRRMITARAIPSEGVTVVSSRSHGDADALAQFTAGRAVAKSVSAGSSLKFCLVAAGEADIYPRFGRTMEWDTAAGDAVLRAAGGRVTDLDGRPLTYGKPGLRESALRGVGKRTLIRNLGTAAVLLYGGTRFGGPKGVSPMSHKKLIPLLAVALSLAAAGAALAATSYSVKLGVPSITQTPKVKFKSTGVTKSTSHLTVFIAAKCAANPKAEANVSGPEAGKKAWQIISKNVSRSYSASKTSPVGSIGVHYVCAYLTPTRGSSVRAHATGSYTALTPGY